MSRKLLLLLLPVFLSACDNVGLAFDPDVTSNPTSQGTIQRMVSKGVTVDGRPKVRSVFPSGNGWAGTVPIVVEFNETLNEGSVVPGGAEPPTLFVRRAGGIGGGSIAADYDFLFGGRVVVIRPVAPFDTSLVETFEVVISPELRDADGIRYGGTEEEVIETFTADEDISIDDGEIVTILPADNAKDQQRESSVYVVFSKPVDKSSLSGGSGGNYVVRDAAGGLVAAGSFMLMAAFPLGTPVTASTIQYL